MISPGAWPLEASPRRRHWRWRSILGEEFFPSWTLRPPLLGRPSFSSPTWSGEAFPLPPPRLRWRSAPRCLQMSRPIQPCAGDLSWSLRPFSWPSSPAPHRAPETASSLRWVMLDLRVVEPDSQSAPLSLPSPIILAWRLRFFPRIY